MYIYIYIYIYMYTYLSRSQARMAAEPQISQAKELAAKQAKNLSKVLTLHPETLTPKPHLIFLLYYAQANC